MTVGSYFPSSFSYLLIFQDAQKKNALPNLHFKITQYFLWVMSWRSNVIPSYGWVNTEIWFQTRDKFQSANINHITNPLFLLLPGTQEWWNHTFLFEHITAYLHHLLNKSVFLSWTCFFSTWRNQSIGLCVRIEANHGNYQEGLIIFPVNWKNDE